VITGERFVSAPAADEDLAVKIENLSFYYGEKLTLRNISMTIPRHDVTAFIGPSGCGKSTLLRCLNRMNDMIDGIRMEGRIFVEGNDILAPGVEVTELRRSVGMVFQRSTPFPKSIYENVVFGARVQKRRTREELDALVEKSLRAVALWEEVKDRLQASALDLSGGQQQRLCIGRALAVEPRILLMDEPCSALDPIATGKIEELMHELKRDYTIVIVTHNMQQAARVSNYTGFLLTGELVEFGRTQRIFQRPVDKRTEDYITGRFG